MERSFDTQKSKADLMSFSLNAVRIFCLATLCVGAAQAQVVINEIVYDEANADSSDVDPDTREFVELYNTGAAAVDIGNWTVGSVNLVDGSPIFADTIPAGTMLAAGGYYVLGAPGVPNLNQDLGAGELWQDINTVIELKDSSSSLVDALAYEVNKDPQLTNATAAQIAQLGHGWWGNTQSYNTSYPRLSLGRFIDGRDTNNNGRDFGTIPMSPGASNTLPFNANYSLPNVDALSIGAPMPNSTASFYQARTIDPTVAYQPGVDINPIGNYDNPAININPNAIPASPQGGKALIAWDPSGGGNFVTSMERVDNYDLYAYLSTTPYGETGNESTAYGIGTAGPLFNNSIDPLGKLTTPGTITSNDATGVFWLFQKETQTNEPDHVKLMLIDANDGGDSRPEAADWTVVTTIDLAGQASAWHRLSIDIGAGGAVTAKHNDQVFTFNTSQDLVGTFWVGYREALVGTPIEDYPGKVRPPTFDMVAVAPANNADFNNDNVVDGNDFLIWQRGLGLTGQTDKSTGDADGNGVVNGADLSIWKMKFGGPPAVAAGGAVPEPATYVLAAALTAALGCCRNRRQMGQIA